MVAVLALRRRRVLAAGVGHGRLPEIRHAFDRQVETVLHRRRGDLGERLIPVRATGLTLTEPPLLRGFQRPAEILDLEGRVHRGQGIIVFLGRNQGRAEVQATVLFDRPGGQKVGRGLDQFGVAAQHGGVFLGPPDQFSQEDRMRLLPHDEGRDETGAVAALRPDHLGPPGALDAVTGGLSAGVVEIAQIPGQTALQHLRAPPHGLPAGVPGVHLQMELAVPGVGEEALFLRRQFARAVHGGQVLRQDHAAFQLGGARVGRAGEVDGAALGPEGVPVRGHGLDAGRIGRRFCRVRLLVEANRNGEPVTAIGDDVEAVGAALLDLTRCRDAGIIGGVVQAAADADVACVEGGYLQTLRARAVEAGRIGVDGRVHPGIADLDAQAVGRD
ncbi:hypothetical protein D3C85_662270 [compost metagenome]